MKGIQRRNELCLFRVCLKFYPEEFVKKVFGEGKKEGGYMLFEKAAGEDEIYRGFGRLLEMIADGG